MKNKIFLTMLALSVALVNAQKTEFSIIEKQNLKNITTVYSQKEKTVLRINRFENFISEEKIVEEIALSYLKTKKDSLQTFR